MGLGWHFDAIEKLDITSQDVKIIDGHIWITSGTLVSIYNIVGDQDGYVDLERTEWTDLTKPQFRGLVLVKQYTIPWNSSVICDAYDKVWIINSTYTHMVYITKDFIDHTLTIVTLPATMWSDVIYAYGKLWMVEVQVVPANQHLHSYDGTTWTNTEIPFRCQQAKTKIVDGKNGFIYLTRFNNVGLAKFANQDSSFVSFVQVNAEPTSLVVTDEGIMVGSYAGMISKIDPTNDAVTHMYSSMEVANNFVDTGDGYIWASYSTKFLSILKSDLSVIQIQGEDADWTYETSDFTGSIDFKQILIMPSFNFTWWNGSAMQTGTAEQRLIFVSSSNIYVFRNSEAFCRKVFGDVESRGYITSGDDYAGD